MLPCNDNQYCVCFDEHEERDSNIWSSVHANFGYMRNCAINIILDSSEQPQCVQLATQKPHIHSEGLS